MDKSERPTARLRNGWFSQTVIFPPGFEIDAKKVHIRRDGGRVIITPIDEKPRKFRLFPSSRP